MTPHDMSSWIALFTGLYALAVGIGELRNPGGWAVMLKEFEAFQALRFLTGVISIGIGGMIYLACSSQAPSWLAIGMSVIGGLMVVKGALLIASGDRLMVFARQLIGKAGSFLPGFVVFLGAVLILLAFARL